MPIYSLLPNLKNIFSRKKKRIWLNLLADRISAYPITTFPLSENPFSKQPLPRNFLPNKHNNIQKTHTSEHMAFMQHRFPHSQ